MTLDRARRVARVTGGAQAKVVIHMDEGGDVVQVRCAWREGRVGTMVAVHTTRRVLVVRVVAPTYKYTHQIVRRDSNEEEYQMLLIDQKL